VDFSRDVESQETAAPNILANVVALVADLREQERLIAQAEANLKLLQDRYNTLVLDLIPEAMAQLRLSEVRLDDGATLTVNDGINVYINKENTEAAYAWLRQNKLGSIIKSSLEVDLRAVEDADKVFAKLADIGVEFTTRENVHAATLKATVRAMLERGVTPPAAISVHQFKKAGIKEPKK
jgi:hypothetical protein